MSPETNLLPSAQMGITILIQEIKEIDRWLELYETHDKYTFVGHLVDDPVNDILDNVGDVDEESISGEEEQKEEVSSDDNSNVDEEEAETVEA